MSPIDAHPSSVAGTSGTSGAAFDAPDAARPTLLREAELRPRYEAYRRHQVRELLSLMPRDGLRPLYRQAVRAMGHGEAEVDDPLALVSEFVERHLPLPPFALWCIDVLDSPEAHLEEPWMEGAAPAREAPLTLDVRTLALGSATWRTELRVWHGGGAWRGHLSFGGEGHERSYRTGEIFRESRLGSLRDRFREFDSRTLEAFLRSAIP